MSEHFFGLGPGHLTKRCATAAKREGAILVNYTEPNGYRRHWFCCRNLGHPFDQDTATRVMDAVRRAASKADLEKIK